MILYYVTDRHGHRVSGKHQEPRAAAREAHSADPNIDVDRLADNFEFHTFISSMTYTMHQTDTPNMEGA